MARIALLLIAAAALLAGLWFGLRPAPAPAPAAVSTGATARVDEAAAPAVETTKRFALQPVPAGETAPVLQVQVGDPVELQVTAPSDDELHLHGYDLSMELKAGVPGTLRFQAEHAGRFDLELHHANAELAVLEVHPR